MGPAGFDPIANPKFGLHVHRLAGAPLVCDSHLLADDGDAHVFDQGPGGVEEGDDVDRLHLSRTRYAADAVGNWRAGDARQRGTGCERDSGSNVARAAMEAVEAMPAMLSVILGTGKRGLVVAGMLAATMSVNSSYLLGWSAVISQDIILPLRRALGRARRAGQKRILVNRFSNVFVSLFVMFWGLYYSLPGAVYLYLGITATIYLAGTFVASWRLVLEARQYEQVAISRWSAARQARSFRISSCTGLENITGLCGLWSGNGRLRPGVSGVSAASAPHAGGGRGMR